jgi:hypothetical protein
LFKADTLLDPPAQQRVVDLFTSCGVDPDRLQFQSRVPSLF